MQNESTEKNCQKREDVEYIPFDDDPSPKDIQMFDDVIFFMNLLSAG